MIKPKNVLNIFFFKLNTLTFQSPPGTSPMMGMESAPPAAIPRVGFLIIVIYILSRWLISYHGDYYLIMVIIIKCFSHQWFSDQSDFLNKVNIQFSDFLIIVTIKAQLCSCQKLPLSVFGFRWFIGVLVSVICCVMPIVNPKLIWKSSTLWPRFYNVQQWTLWPRWHRFVIKAREGNNSCCLQLQDLQLLQKLPSCSKAAAAVA